MMLVSTSISFAYPSNAMVNVCIMDSKYTTVEKESVEIYGTEDAIIKTKDSEIPLLKDCYALITRKDKIYNLTIFNKKFWHLNFSFDIYCPVLKNIKCIISLIPQNCNCNLNSIYNCSLQSIFFG